jgi:hypothetical protein
MGTLVDGKATYSIRGSWETKETLDAVRAKGASFCPVASRPGVSRHGKRIRLILRKKALSYQNIED